MSHTNARQSDQQAAPPVIPNPEVMVKPKRRQFTAEYKRRILQEADACTQTGEIGALLRREGLYSSHLTTWRQQRQRGELQGLTPAKRGRKADPLTAENARLQRETERLKAQLARAELIIDVQKKSRNCLACPRSRPTRSNDGDHRATGTDPGPGHRLRHLTGAAQQCLSRPPAETRAAPEAVTGAGLKRGRARRGPSHAEQ